MPLLTSVDWKGLPIRADKQAKLARCVKNIETKFLATKYHIDNMDRLEERFRKEDEARSREDAEDPEGLVEVEYETISRPIDFEFEAVLFQSRAALEIFSNAVALRCNEERYEPKKLAKNVKSRASSLERKGESFAPKLLECLKRHYFPFYVHTEEESGMSWRDWAAHYGTMPLGPHVTKVVEGKATSHGPTVYGDFPIVASTFAKMLLFSTEWLVKESFFVIFGGKFPNEHQFLIRRTDLTRLGIYAFE